MYNTIVVGLDGSKREHLVIEHAHQLASRFGAKLHLCRAMTIPMSIPTAAWRLSGEDLEAFLVDHGRQELEASARAIPAELVEALHCRVGQPSDVICRLADEMQADLIVIGSHGYDALDRLVGTTAAKVVNHAHCSVIVVRKPGR